MLVKVFDGNRTERVEPDVQRHSFDVEERKHFFGEVQAGRRRRGRAGVARIDGLVARRVVERLGDVRRQRRLAGRLAVQPEPPPSFSVVLEQLDRSVSAPRPQTPGRPRQTFPEPVVVEPLQQQYLALRLLDRNAGRDDLRVVDHDERVADHVR